MPSKATIAVHYTNYMERTSTEEAKYTASYVKRDVTYSLDSDTGKDPADPAVR